MYRSKQRFTQSDDLPSAVFAITFYIQNINKNVQYNFCNYYNTTQQNSDDRKVNKTSKTFKTKLKTINTVIVCAL